MTDQERQLLEILNEQQNSDADFSLVIEHKGGAWDITLPAALSPGAKPKTTRGTGATFAEAWDNDRRVDWP
jgi:hypothetical protein